MDLASDLIMKRHRVFLNPDTSKRSYHEQCITVRFTMPLCVCETELYCYTISMVGLISHTIRAVEEREGKEGPEAEQSPTFGSCVQSCSTLR